MKFLLIFFIVLLYISDISLKPITFDQITKKMITVEVKGYLENPGIFEVSNLTSFNELLNSILLYDDSDYSHISELYKLKDGDVIVINQYDDGLISLNSATVDELITIPGIGLVLANNIIEYRNNHTFKSIDDLLNVKGIGQKKFNIIKEYVKL